MFDIVDYICIMNKKYKVELKFAPYVTEVEATSEEEAIDEVIEYAKEMIAEDPLRLLRSEKATEIEE